MSPEDKQELKTVIEDAMAPFYIALGRPKNLQIFHRSSFDLSKELFEALQKASDEKEAHKIISRWCLHRNWENYEVWT